MYQSQQFLLVAAEIIRPLLWHNRHNDMSTQLWDMQLCVRTYPWCRKRLKGQPTSAQQKNFQMPNNSPKNAHKLTISLVLNLGSSLQTYTLYNFARLWINSLLFSPSLRNEDIIQANCYENVGGNHWKRVQYHVQIFTKSQFYFQRCFCLKWKTLRQRKAHISYARFFFLILSIYYTKSLWGKQWFYGWMAHWVI